VLVSSLASLLGGVICGSPTFLGKGLMAPCLLASLIASLLASAHVELPASLQRQAAEVLGGRPQPLLLCGSYGRYAVKGSRLTHPQHLQSKPRRQRKGETQQFS